MITTQQRATAIVMRKKEARDTLLRIRAGLRECRLLLLDLYEREGWRALGYSSWRECCAVEFGTPQRHLYRLLTAADVERDLSHGTKEKETQVVTERQARELARLPTGDMRREIWEEAQADGDNTARALRDLVEEKLNDLEEDRQAAALEPEDFAREIRGGHPRPARAPDPIGKIVAKCETCRGLHERLGERAHAADLALDRYLDIVKGGE